MDVRVDQQTLEDFVDQGFQRFQQARVLARTNSWKQRVGLRLDQWVAKDEEEYLERGDLSLEERVSLVEGLSRLNQRSGYNRVFLQELRNLIFRLPKPSGLFRQPLKILDLGAGGGGMLKAIDRWSRREGFLVDLAGIDLSLGFAKLTEYCLARQGISVKIYQGDACQLDNFEDSSFDLVISSYVVHHVRTPGKVACLFSEARRVARLGWLIADFDRRLYGPWFAGMAGMLFGASWVLNADGIKSIRRAYRADEINFILRESQNLQGLSGMECRPWPFLPYWVVKGRKDDARPRSFPADL